MSTNSLRWMLGHRLFVWVILAMIGGSTLPIHGSMASPSQPQAVISACDPINADTTWIAANLYVANNCAVTIPAGVTLTLEPGTTVKFLGGNAVLIVQGTLDAQGTEPQPITFSSVHDNAHGLAAPGSSASPAAGDWYGVHFAPDSSGMIRHAFIGYGTAYSAPPVVGWNKAQIYADSATLNFHNLEVAHGNRPGLFLRSNDNTVTLADSFIHHHTSASYPYGSAIYQESIHWQPGYSNLTFSDNDRNEVTLGDFRGDLAEDITLGGANFGVLCGYTLCQLNIPNGRTLTVAPGTQIDFGGSYGIGVASGGSLNAEGTEAQPVIFTSQQAEAGVATQYWLGIWAKAGSNLRLDHCDISYADDTNFGSGGLEINSDDAEVNNCQIHHNRRTGLYLYSRDGATIHPTLANVDVTDNGQTGVYLGASYGGALYVTWDGGSISRNGWSGMEDYTWVSSLYPDLSNLTVDQNGALGDNSARRRGVSFIHHSVHLTLENITFGGNQGEAIHWFCNGSITASDLAASGNGADALILPGCAVSGGRQWNLGDVGIPTKVTGNIEISANGLLSLQPGTVLRFDQRADGGSYGVSVPDQASLYAVGTAQKPIRFVGTSAEMDGWNGISARDRATLVLRHCEIGYGGTDTANNLSASVEIRWGLSGAVPTVDIQACEIHHSGRKGIHFDFANFANTPAPIFRYNHLHDNRGEAVANWNAPPLDARDNYWGDPTGPFHATQNPTGLGDTVGDNVLFYPWLGAPGSGEAISGGRMIVSTGAPNQVSPGETVDYAIQYLNGLTETLRSSILMLQLPEASYFVESSGGGLYWPDRHQVVWKLGDLAAGANGFVSVRLRFQWGLAADYADGSLTQFAAQNYNAAALDIAEYNAYASTLRTVTAVTELSMGEFATVRAANPNLESLYQAALSEGFQPMSAAGVTYADGTVVVNAALRTPDRKYGRILSLSDGQVLASTVGGGKLDLRDTTGGMSADLNRQIYEFWGSWAPDELSRTGATCTEDRCFYSCMIKAKTWGAVARKLAGAVSWVIPPLGAVWSSYEVYDEITTYQQCKKDCQQDPTTHCCTPGETRWSPTGLKQQCAQYSCDAVGTWKQAPDVIEKCSFGQRCVAGKGSSGGCKDCEEDLIAAQFTPISVRTGDEICLGAGNTLCRDLTVRRAKDPNDITGLAGDLLPSQTVTYTIRYENEGAGRAYGVYVVNPLPTVFDASTINFVHKNGVYLSNSREIAWMVGELGPKGAVDSEGVITYTVALTGGLPSGTIVANGAVVYFPSVPEETPTNTWVNLVSPLVAEPQTLQTNYMTPLAVTLHGREVSSLPLTYAITEQPHGGTLTGSAPNVTYTPAENFTGPDSFSFTVDNGASTSRAAQVRIEVSPAGDTTPPTVRWTIPAADETNVVASLGPIFTDTVGPIYSPIILFGVSEALDPSTVTTATVTLAGSGGLVSALVSFDAGSNQIVLRPRAALTDGMYTVTVSTPVTDRAGNGLASLYVFRFSVGEGKTNLYLPTVQRK